MRAASRLARWIAGAAVLTGCNSPGGGNQTSLSTATESGTSVSSTGSSSTSSSGTSTTDVSTSVATSAGSSETGALFDVAPPDPTSGDVVCSADLHSVLDGNGQIVMECPPEEGCVEGECVPACEAASATQANFGCQFLLPTPPSSPFAQPPCFAAFLTNGWGHPAKIEVKRDGVTHDLATFARVVTPGLDPADWPALPAEGVPAESVAVLFLSGDPTAIHPNQGGPLFCPVTTAVEASTEIDGSGRGPAWSITADIPLTAYDMMPFGGANSYIPSAELLYPTSVWGQNYVAIAPPAGTHDTPGPLWLQIVGIEDGTSVDISPTAELLAGPGVDAIAQGGSATVSLSAGEFIQWQVPTNGTDPSGTRILSDKPVALHTGNRFLRLQPESNPGGEATHQQNSSVTALGFEYLAAPYETRRADLAPEEVDYRFVGTVDGTTLSYDPPLPGAPVSLALGEVVDFATTEAFRVRSQDDQHPFLMAQIMDTANIPGGTRPGATAPGFMMLLGDEEFVIMLPPAQFLERYVFFTDPIYATTNLVLTRVNTGEGFEDVTVDCLGTITGWQPVGDDGMYEVATADLVRADVGVGECDNGHHTAESEGPFGLVVWGLDSFSSYAYPAGGNAIALTDLVIPAG